MIFWIGFITVILILLLLDLAVLHRDAHEVSTKESIFWTLVWITLSLLFSVFVYYAFEKDWFDIGLNSHLTGREAALNYLTGYLIELSLSADNIFVIAMIITYFHIPLKHQHGLLFWGILGALVFRGIMIGVGVALIHRFEWIIYVFGAILIYSALKMLLMEKKEIEPGKNPVVRFVERFFPVAREMEGGKFFTCIQGKRAVTPLFIALIVIETSDIMFAVDSIPAIFAITTEPFIVFTSNVFAILGLRSMYFVLASVIKKFRYLQQSLVFILGYVGIKMMIQHHFHLPVWLSLCIILFILIAGIVASVIADRKAR